MGKSFSLGQALSGSRNDPDPEMTFFLYGPRSWFNIGHGAMCVKHGVLVQMTPPTENCVGFSPLYAIILVGGEHHLFYAVEMKETPSLAPLAQSRYLQIDCYTDQVSKRSLEIRFTFIRKVSEYFDELNLFVDTTGADFQTDIPVPPFAAESMFSSFSIVRGGFNNSGYALRMKESSILLDLQAVRYSPRGNFPDPVHDVTWIGGEDGGDCIALQEKFVTHQRAASYWSLKRGSKVIYVGEGESKRVFAVLSGTTDDDIEWMPIERLSDLQLARLLTAIDSGNITARDNMYVSQRGVAVRTEKLVGAKEELIKQLEKLGDEIVTLRSRYDELHLAYVELGHERKLLKTQATELEEQLDTARSELDKVSKARSKLLAEVAALEANIQEIIAALQSHMPGGSSWTISDIVQAILKLGQPDDELMSGLIIAVDHVLTTIKRSKFDVDRWIKPLSPASDIYAKIAYIDAVVRYLVSDKGSLDVPETDWAKGSASIIGSLAVLTGAAVGVLSSETRKNDTEHT